MDLIIRNVFAQPYVELDTLPPLYHILLVLDIAKPERVLDLK